MPAAQTPLRLAAEDADDVPPISALVQDAVLTRGDMAFLPKTKRFALVLNRFRWEAANARGRGERVRAGLRIEHVLKAEGQGFANATKETVLSLLAVVFKPYAEGGGEVTLTFSGDKAVRLHVEALEAELADLTQPWQAKAKPTHDGG